MALNEPRNLSFPRFSQRENDLADWRWAMVGHAHRALNEVLNTYGGRSD